MNLSEIEGAPGAQGLVISNMAGSNAWGTCREVLRKLIFSFCVNPSMLYQILQLLISYHFLKGSQPLFLLTVLEQTWLLGSKRTCCGKSLSGSLCRSFVGLVPPEELENLSACQRHCHFSRYHDFS